MVVLWAAKDIVNAMKNMTHRHLKTRLALSLQLLALGCILATIIYLLGNIIEYNNDYANYCRDRNAAVCFHRERSFSTMLGLVFFFFPLLAVVSSTQLLPKKRRKLLAAPLIGGYMVIWMLAIYLIVIT